jgi:hypothetical protein
MMYIFDCIEMEVDRIEWLLVDTNVHVDSGTTVLTTRITSSCRMSVCMCLIVNMHVCVMVVVQSRLDNYHKWSLVRSRLDEGSVVVRMSDRASECTIEGRLFVADLVMLLSCRT